MLVSLIAQIRLALGALTLVATSTLASADSCRDVFDRGEYENALPLCLAEARHFETGYIYGTLDDCANMIKYYKLDNGATAKGNMGINLLYGRKGCNKNEAQARSYLKAAISDGRAGYANILGDHYKNTNPSEARKFYRLSARSTSSSKWAQDRARDSYRELMDLLSPRQKKNFHLESMKLKSFETAWQKELGKKSVSSLVNMLGTDELVELFLSSQISNVQNRCELGRQISSQDFSSLMSMLEREGKKTPLLIAYAEEKKSTLLVKPSKKGLEIKKIFRRHIDYI